VQHVAPVVCVSVAPCMPAVPTCRVPRRRTSEVHELASHHGRCAELAMLMRRHTIVSDVITCCAVVVENIITGLVQLFLTDARNGTGRDNHVLPLVTKDNNCIYILLNVTTRRDANG